MRARGAFLGVQDRMARFLLNRAERVLRRGRARAALGILGRAIEGIEDRYPDEEGMPEEVRSLYGRALLLRARALAQNRNVNAVAAYLRARQRVPLEPEDIDFLAGHLIGALPRTFFAFPIYIEWYDQSDDPAEAEAKLRHIATIAPDEDIDDSLFQIKVKLNEYFAAHFPTWLWTLEHLANAHELQGDLDAAHACLAEWRARDPENATVRCRERILAGKRHLKRRQVLEALAAFETAMLSKGNEANEAARLLLDAARSNRIGRMQIRRVRRAFRAFVPGTTDARLLVEYASWVESHDRQAAVAALHRVLEIDPSDAEALWQLAKHAHREDDPARALDLASRYLEHVPEDDGARVFAAHLAAGLGEHDRVITLLAPMETCAATETLLLARALLICGRLDEAEERLASIDVESLSEGAQRSYDLLAADLCFERRSFGEAATRYRDLVEQEPENTDLLNRLGRSALAQGNWEEAEAVFTRALALDPNDVAARNGRGEARFQTEQLDEAAEDFRASLREMPRQLRTLYALARCVMDENPNAAKTLLLRAVDLAPDFYAAWIALAYVHESIDNWNGAAHAYERAFRVAPEAERATVRARLGYAAMRAEDFERARNAFTQEAQEGHANGTLHYYLGYCCVRLGEWNEAAAHWKTAILLRDDPELRADLAWLHLRLADAAREANRRVEMTQHWNTAWEYLPDDAMTRALVARWANEAQTRLRGTGSTGPTPRDVQIAHDLMTEVLQHDGGELHQLLAGLSAARMGDWGLAEELVRPIVYSGEWEGAASYFLGICQWEQNLPDAALAALDMNRDWGRWETQIQSLRVQIFLDAEEVEGTARELAMLRAMSSTVCPAETAIAVFLNMRCWRHVYDLVQQAPLSERTDFMHYALGVAALMSGRESEGLDVLERVGEASEWHASAQRLRRTGFKRQALRAFQTLGWEDVVASLEQVLDPAAPDPLVEEWMERARDFAILSRWDAMGGDELVERWRTRLRQEPHHVRPLHQWAVFAYWSAQAQPTPTRWRIAMALWGTLLNLASYWRGWVLARLRQHDAETWTVDIAEDRLSSIVRGVRQKLMNTLTSDMTDAILQADGASEDPDDVLLDFLREYQTAALWQEWIEHHDHLRDSVLPYGGFLLDVLGRKQDVEEILNTAARLHPTALGERLLIYLSPVGPLLAAAETGNERLARDRAERRFDDPDPVVRRYARIVFVLATHHAESLLNTPREGFDLVLKAWLCATEVEDSALLESIDWASIIGQFGDRLASEIDAGERQLPETRVMNAAAVRDLLKRAYELTQVEALVGAIARVSVTQARALVTLGRKPGLGAERASFTELDAEALELLHETLSLAPDNVLLQKETAQLRLRRGLFAAEQGRLNEALIDLSRAHELDPVSHRITTTYANFMMEQAAKMWMDPRHESQREALSLAYRVLSTNPADAQLLARCSRFLDLPEDHALRQTPEYRRLATLFLRYAHDDSYEE